ISATGTGGRQARTEEIYGNVWDHFAIEYDFANGAKRIHFSRQQQGCSNTYKVEIVCKEGFGQVDVGRGIHQISGANAWSYDGEKNNPYETQHEELFASIRAGKPMNEGELIANSTMLAVLGRMVGYSGQTIIWEDALKSEVVLGPSLGQYSWDLDWKINPVAVPGVTKVV